MRVIVIGGTRFLGPWLVRRLVASGHDVTVFHRGRTRADLPPEVVEITDPRAGMPLLEFPSELMRASPDAVVHMIAMGEGDSRAAARAFRGRAGRLIGISSADVYRAYGRFTRLEPGPVEACPLDEDAALRSVLFPYRRPGTAPDALEYWYEKLLVEQEVLHAPDLQGTVLRLPKLYGPGDNADFSSVRGCGAPPGWRWTHGYVENVAAAIALAATHPAGAGRVFNVGEEVAPTALERLASVGLPPPPAEGSVDYEFGQDLVCDTNRIRRELGFVDPVPYAEGLRRTMSASPFAKTARA